MRGAGTTHEATGLRLTQVGDHLGALVVGGRHRPPNLVNDAKDSVADASDARAAVKGAQPAGSVEAPRGRHKVGRLVVVPHVVLDHRQLVERDAVDGASGHADGARQHRRLGLLCVGRVGWG